MNASISIIIPSHGRESILTKTCEFYLRFYKNCQIIILDSSGLVSGSLKISPGSPNQISIISVSRTNPHSKLAFANDLIKSDIVLLASNDDLYCFSLDDICAFKGSNAQCMFPRWLMLKDFVKAPKSFLLWEAWCAFSEASRLTPSDRLVRFSNQGINAFYGVFKTSTFKEMASCQEHFLQGLDESSWSIAENLVNILCLSLSWYQTTGSWCFRKLDRKYSQNKNWRPAWVVFDELRRDGRLELLLKALESFLNNSRFLKFHDASLHLTHIERNIESYRKAVSRIWHRGHNFLISDVYQELDPAPVSLADKDRFDFLIGPRLNRQPSPLFTDQWVADANAVNAFNDIPIGFFDTEKGFEISRIET